MPSEIHCKVQNVLMPGSSEAALQSPGPVLQTLEQTTDELEMRERKKKKERAREGSGVSWSTRERERKGGMKAPQHSADGALQWRRQGGRCPQGPNEVRTEFRDVGTPACKDCRSEQDACKKGASE